MNRCCQVGGVYQINKAAVQPAMTRLSGPLRLFRHSGQTVRLCVGAGQWQPATGQAVGGVASDQLWHALHIRTNADMLTGSAKQQGEAVCLLLSSVCRQVECWKCFSFFLFFFVIVVCVHRKECSPYILYNIHMHSLHLVCMSATSICVWQTNSIVCFYVPLHGF